MEVEPTSTKWNWFTNFEPPKISVKEQGWAWKWHGGRKNPLNFSTAEKVKKPAEMNEYRRRSVTLNIPGKR